MAESFGTKTRPEQTNKLLNTQVCVRVCVCFSWARVYFADCTLGAGGEAA